MKDHYGRILQVDLTTGDIRKRKVYAETTRRFIGDFGISLRLACDLLKPGTDPISPGNIIIISAGPLVGTKTPSAVRSSIVTRFPLTGAVSFGNTGMGLGRRLKAAGYDYLVITGRADQPVYLKITGHDVQVCHAHHLWGKDTFETTDWLWQELGKTYSILAMGQAGENQVRASVALVDRIASAGKGGLPAVMGSKNLKAIAVSGNERVEVFDPERLEQAIAPLLKLVSQDSERETYRTVGKMSRLGPAIKLGIPYHNRTEICPREECGKTYSIDEYLKYKGKRVGCPGCAYPCKDALEIKEGEYQGLATNVSSFFGRLVDMGVYCGVGAIDRVIKCMDTANRYGIDSHIFAPTVDLAVELYERGIITIGDTDGLVLRRDMETTLTLLEKVAFRQGIGDILADGSLGIIKHFGNQCEKYSSHIKGQDAQQDARPRQLNGSVFTQMVNPEGGSPHHASSLLLTITRAARDSSDAVAAFQRSVTAYCRKIGVPEEAMGRILQQPLGYNVGRLTRYAEDFHVVLTCLGICHYRTNLLDIAKLAELYSAATGIDMSPSDMLEAGERIWNLYRMLNVREGFSRKDDRIPARWLEPIRAENGKVIPLMDCTGEPLSASDVERLIDDYYEERGWEVAKGVPSAKKLGELALASLIGSADQQ